MEIDDIVKGIQAGDNAQQAALIEDLASFIRWAAIRYYRNCAGRCEYEDLTQAAALGVLEAVETYKPGEGAAFTSWAYHYIQKECGSAAGIPTAKKRRRAGYDVVSLSDPAPGEGLSIEDTIPAPEGVDGIEATEERIYWEQLRAALDAAMKQLPAEQVDAITRSYYDRQSDDAIAEAQGRTRSEVQKSKRQGLRALRMDRRLRSAVKLELRSCTVGCGLSAFRNTGMSIEERYLIYHEE